MHQITYFIAVILLFLHYDTACQSKNSTIDSLERIILQDTILNRSKGDAIAELDIFYWAMDPRKCGRHMDLLDEIIGTTKDQSLEIAYDFCKMRTTFNQAKFDESLNLSHTALLKAKALRDTSNIVKILVHIAALNNAEHSGNDVGGLRQAQEYLNKAKALLVSNINPIVYSSYRQTQAGIYLAGGNVKDAILVLKENLDFISPNMSGLKLKMNQAYTYNLLGRCYLASQNLIKAGFYLDKAEKIVTDYDMHGIKNLVYSHQAFLMEKQGNIIKAEAYYQKNISEIPYMSENKVPVILSIVSDFYARRGQWENAYNYLSRYRNFKDSLMRHQSSVDFLEFQEKYQSKEKEARIAKLAVENQLVESQKSRFKLGFILSTLLFLTVMGLGFLFYRTKTKLIDAVEEKEKVLSLVAHDIRSPLLGLQAAIPLIIDAIETGHQDTQISLLKQLQSTLSQLGILIDNVFRWIRINQNKAEIKNTLFGLNDELELVVNEITYKASQRKIRIQVTSEGSYQIFADRLILMAVIRNLIDNAIKFSYDYGMVNIKISKHHHDIWFDVIDYGVGVDASLIDALFTGNPEIVRAGISGMKGSGLGLFISHQLAGKCNFQLKYITSSLPETTFRIIIPS